MIGSVSPDVMRPRILLADDYPGMLTALTRLLGLDHDIVGSVADGEAALEAAVRLVPDVVVLDLNIPNANGLETCQKITHAIPQTKVIVLTAVHDKDVKEKALAMGACAFVEKQADMNHLLSAIRAACR
jgi:DNA-binding NarL/FixJ family response regulator